MDRNPGLTPEPLFLALARPTLLMGVPHSAVMANGMGTMLVFIFTGSMLWLLVCIPIHVLLYLLTQIEPRFAEFSGLWWKTRGMGFFQGNSSYWGAASHGPLSVDLPNARGRRRAAPARIVC